MEGDTFWISNVDSRSITSAMLARVCNFSMLIVITRFYHRLYSSPPHMMHSSSLYITHRSSNNRSNFKPIQDGYEQQNYRVYYGTTYVPLHLDRTYQGAKFNDLRQLT